MYRTCVACVQCTKYIVGTPWSGLQVHTGPNGVKISEILDFATAPKFQYDQSHGFSLWVASNRTQARDMYPMCVACVQCTKYIVGTPWSGLRVHTSPNGVKNSKILDFATAPKFQYDQSHELPLWVAYSRTQVRDMYRP
jgi:hypothetical protein